VKNAVEALKLGMRRSAQPAKALTDALEALGHDGDEKRGRAADATLDDDTVNLGDEAGADDETVVLDPNPNPNPNPNPKKGDAAPIAVATPKPTAAASATAGGKSTPSTPPTPKMSMSTSMAMAHDKEEEVAAAEEAEVPALLTRSTRSGTRSTAAATKAPTTKDATKAGEAALAATGSRSLRSRHTHRSKSGLSKPSGGLAALRVMKGKADAGEAESEAGGDQEPSTPSEKEGTSGVGSALGLGLTPVGECVEDEESSVDGSSPRESKPAVGNNTNAKASATKPQAKAKANGKEAETAPLPDYIKNFDFKKVSHSDSYSYNTCTVTVRH